MPHKWAISDMEKVFLRFGGRCAYYGTPLLLQTMGKYALHFKFYSPPEFCGYSDIDNIVTVCDNHTKFSNIGISSAREDIPDINTFGDVFEQLIRAVITVEKYKADADPALAATMEKVVRIKRFVNMKLEELALNMRYKPFSDWIPDQFEIIQEENNSFPDLIEKTVLGALDNPDENVVRSDVDALTNQIKQITTEKKYRVVRQHEED